MRNEKQKWDPFSVNFVLGIMATDVATTTFSLLPCEIISLWELRCFHFQNWAIQINTQINIGYIITPAKSFSCEK